MFFALVIVSTRLFLWRLIMKNLNGDLVILFPKRLEIKSVKQIKVKLAG